MIKTTFCIVVALFAFSAVTTATPLTATTPCTTTHTVSNTGVNIKQLQFDSGKNLYEYLCYIGLKRSDNLQCSEMDETTWNNPTDVDMRFRCPKTGFVDPIEYAEVHFWTTTHEVNCDLTDGDIGSNLIEIRVQAFNTLKFDYDSSVYSQ